MTSVEYIMLFLCEFIAPMIFIFVGVFQWRFPPQEIGAIGYRTTMAEKNQLTWDMAQTTFGKYSLIMGIASILVAVATGVPMMLLRPDENTATAIVILACVVQSILVFTAIFLTEKKLNKYFNKDGTPK